MRTLKLLIVANNCPWSSWDKKIVDLRAWFLPKIALDISIAHTHFDKIPFVPYDADVPGGLGVEPAWYDRFVTPYGQGFDIIMFVVNTAQWPYLNRARGWRTDRSDGPVELQVCADENEATYKDGVKLYTTFESYARHEIMHALFILQYGDGVRTCGVDPKAKCDSTHYWWDKGQLENALGDISLPIPNRAEEISRLRALIERLLAQVLVIKKSTMDEKLNKFCLAVQSVEDYVLPGGKYRNGEIAPTGSRSYKNFNPGNLKYVGQRLAIGQDKNGFARFASYEDGFNTLALMVKRVCQGISNTYNKEAMKRYGHESPEMTFPEFFSIYAPSTDDNNPDAYADTVSKMTGFSVGTRMSWLIS